MSSDYVVSTLSLLHPGATVASSRGRSASSAYVLVPSAKRPSLVLPAGSPARAAAACRGYSESVGGRAGLRSEWLARAFGSGLGDRAFRDRVSVGPSAVRGLDAELGRMLGADVRLAFAVGNVRANRKPVVLALGPTGEVLAFVKLGINALTDSLVVHEAESLRLLAELDLGIVQVPRVVCLEEWAGHPLLVTETLPVGEQRAADADAPLREAMLRVARARGVTLVPLTSLPWWIRLGSLVENLPPSANAGRLAAAMSALSGRSLEPVPAGCWHGDWNPGNAAVLADRVLVWDWERFGSGVPLGWDALHRALWGIVPRGKAPTAEALRGLLDKVPELLGPFDLTEGQADLAASLYLLELASRFVADDQRSLGVAMGAVDTWLLPVLEERLRAGVSLPASPGMSAEVGEP